MLNGFLWDKLDTRLHVYKFVIQSSPLLWRKGGGTASNAGLQGLIPPGRNLVSYWFVKIDQTSPLNLPDGLLIQSTDKWK